MYRISLILLCAVLLQLSCTKDDGPTSPQLSGGTLSGIVNDRAGNPIQGVGVHYLYETKSLSPLSKLSGICPSTTIMYSIPSPAHVTLRILRWYTREPIDTLVDAQQNAGIHEVLLDAAHMTNGLYLFQLVIDTVYTEKIFALLNTDLGSLVETEPLATSNAQGVFFLPHGVFGFGVTMHVTSPTGPAVSDSVCISTSIQLVLYKQGYQTLVRPVSIDTNQSASMAFVLLSQGG